jgi:NAD(P)-dependent dehydrogenase (short-subunit alcohol dehydrogenase family)
MGKGGSIINTCSIQAFDPSAHLLAYAATKAALVNLTKGMAKAVAKEGYPRERRGTRTGMDPANSLHDAEVEV